MLRESSKSTPRKFCCATAALPNRRKRDSIAVAASPGAVRDHRQAHRRPNDRCGDVGSGPWRKAKFALAKDHRGKLEKKSEEGVEHECSGFYFG